MVLIFGCLASMVDARCNLTAEPLELIDCLSHMSSIILGLAKNGQNKYSFYVDDGVSFRHQKSLRQNIVDCKVRPKSISRLHWRTGLSTL